MWIVGVPLLAALVFFPFASTFGRRFATALSLAAVTTSNALLLVAVLRLFENQGVADAAGNIIGLSGVTLRGQLFGVDVVANAASLLAALSFGAAFFVGLVGAAFAWGGGPRRQPTPAGAGQILALLFVFGVVELAALAEGLHVTIAAAPMTAALGYGVMLASGPQRRTLDGASRVFTVQRIADAALLIAIGWIWVSYGAFAPHAIAAHLVTAGQNPWLGFEGQVAAALLLGGVALRLACFPWVSMAKDAVGAPVPVVALLIGTTALGMPLLILQKSAVVVFAAPAVMQIGLYVFLLSALFHAAIAATTTKLLATDLHLATTLALIGASAFALGSQTGLLLMFVATTIGAAAMSLQASAVIEAMQGQTDVDKLGGLWRPLKFTFAGRALLTLGWSALPGGVSAVVLCRMLPAAWQATSGRTVLTTTVLLLALVLTFAAYRALHLQFGGESIRGEAPARLVEVRPARWLLPLLFGAVGVVLNVVYVIPPALRPQVGAPPANTLDAVLASSWTAGSTVLATAAKTADLPPSWMLAVVMGLGAAGWIASALFFRRGPSPLFVRVQALPFIAFAGRLLRGGALIERIIDTVVTGPAMKGARFVVQMVLPALIVAPPNRLPALPATFVGFVLRMVHNGDMQRGLLILIASIAGLLWWWSIRT